MRMRESIRAGDAAADDHRREQPDAARRLQQADGIDRIAAQVGQERRHQHDRRHGEQPVQEYEHQADEEVALHDEPRIEERIARGQAVHREQVQAQRRQPGLDHDLGGFEPVEAPPRSSIICSAPMPRASVRKPNQSSRRPGSRSVSGTNARMPSSASSPNGHVDVEDVAPAQVLGEIAARAVGPMKEPITEPVPHRAMALPCSRRADRCRGSWRGTAGSGTRRSCPGRCAPALPPPGSRPRRTAPTPP